MTYSGSGTLTLSAANSYTGLTTIGSGTLSIPVGGSLAGSLTYNSGNESSIAGTLGGSSSILTVAAGTIDLTGSVNGPSVVVSGGTLAESASGSIAGSGANLTVSSGTATLLAANTFTGATTVSGGTLDLANQNALQNSTLTPAGGSVVFDQAVAGNAFNVAGLAGSGNISLQNNAATPAPVALTVTNASANATFSGSLQGPGSLNLNSPGGTLRVNGTSSYTGATTISAGTLRLASNIPVADGSIANATGLTTDNQNYRALDYAGVAFWTPPGSSWTFLAHSGIATDGGGWGLPTPYPTGVKPNAATGFYQSAVLQDYQYYGGAWETMNFPAAGTYSINFYAAYSTAGNGGNEPMNLYFGGAANGGPMNGVLEGSVTPASNFSWTPYSISFYVPVPGSYQVAFQDNPSGGNYINAFTGVTQTLKVATPTLSIPNADFTAATAGTPSYVYNPTGRGWTFNGESGVSQNGSPFSDGSPSGYSAFVQNLGSISQAISFPTAGTYTLSFFTEGRGGGYGPLSFNVELGLNDANFANITSVGVGGLVTPNGTGNYNLVTGTFTIATPGSYTLEFAGTNDPNVSGQDLSSTITDVAVAIPASGVLPTTTPLTVAGGAYFDLGGLSGQTVSTLSGAGTVTNSAMGTTSVLTLAPPSGSNTTFSGVIQDGNGQVGLTLNGDPTAVQVLSGANTYTGGTTVTSGTLRIAPSGSLAASGNLTINPTSGSAGVVTFANSSQTVAAVTSSGTLNLGTASTGPSQLTVTGGMTLQANSVENFYLPNTPNGTSNPLIITTSGASNSLLVTGATTIAFSNPSLGTFDLFSYSGVTAFSNFQLSSAALAANPGFDYQLAQGAGQIDLVVSPASIHWSGLNGGPQTPWDTMTQNWYISGAPTTYPGPSGGVVSFNDTYDGTNAPASTNVYIQDAGVTPAR